MSNLTMHDGCILTTLQEGSVNVACVCPRTSHVHLYGKPFQHKIDYSSHSVQMLFEISHLLETLQLQILVTKLYTVAQYCNYFLSSLTNLSTVQTPIYSQPLSLHYKIDRGQFCLCCLLVRTHLQLQLTKNTTIVQQLFLYQDKTYTTQSKGDICNVLSFSLIFKFKFPCC